MSSHNEEYTNDHRKSAAAFFLLGVAGVFLTWCTQSRPSTIRAGRRQHYPCLHSGDRRAYFGAGSIGTDFSQSLPRPPPPLPPLQHRSSQTRLIACSRKSAPISARPSSSPSTPTSPSIMCYRRARSCDSPRQRKSCCSGPAASISSGTATSAPGSFGTTASRSPFTTPPHHSMRARWRRPRSTACWTSWCRN